MKLTPRDHRRDRKGFLLMEVLLALGVFGMAATGFAVALHRTADLASLAQHKIQISRLLESALDEAMSFPVLEEGVFETDQDKLKEMTAQSLELITTVELLPEMENEDGQLLQEMYRIQVEAFWFENGVAQEAMAETWRYSRLYQP